VIGLRGRSPDRLTGTLLDFGASYSQLDLTPDGGFDYAAIAAAVNSQTRLVHVQRSCGYSWRRSIPVSQIGELAKWLKERWPHLVLFVDNCYGEFVEEVSGLFQHQPLLCDAPFLPS
jgi:cystathionine beta-lyase family protein involved in aluminum resistance